MGLSVFGNDSRFFAKFDSERFENAGFRKVAEGSDVPPVRTVRGKEKIGVEV
jgi:hypothetical protein